MTRVKLTESQSTLLAIFYLQRAENKCVGDMGDASACRI